MMAEFPDCPIAGKDLKVIVRRHELYTDAGRAGGTCYGQGLRGSVTGWPDVVLDRGSGGQARQAEAAVPYL